MRLVVVGGSDAGIAAALRAHELDPSVEATVVVADAFPNFSICGLPYYLSGRAALLPLRRRGRLARPGPPHHHRPRGRRPAAAAGPHRPSDRPGRQAGHHHNAGRWRAPAGLRPAGHRHRRGPGPPPDRRPGPPRGARAAHHGRHLRPPPGPHRRRRVGRDRGRRLHRAGDGRGLHRPRPGGHPGRAGPGGHATVDLDLGRVLGEELGRHGVRVINDVTVKAIHHDAGGLTVAGEPDFAAAADLVLVVVGVRPDTELAVAAGVATGVRGALRVDRRMRTNLPDVLAAGDCVETYHRLLEEPAYLPLGTTAHKQGRIAGETAVGGDRAFAGSLGTQVVKVFELAVARTGLRDPEAREAGFDPLTVASTQYDHKAYYPGAHQLHLRLTGDRQTGRLLGAQLVGDHRGEVAKRVDIPANALFHHMTVDGLSDLDLSYTPPFGSPWDAVQLAAHDWVRQARTAPA